MKDYYKSLLKYESDFEFEVIETITYNENKFLIYQVSTNPENTNKKLLVITTTHGNEFVTALVIPELLEDIVRDSGYYSDWEIKIIVPANPVGLEYQSRYNEDGCDINRDFNSFNTLGARVQRDIINDYKPDIIVSLHESQRDGFFLFSEQTVDTELEKLLIEDLVAENVELGKQNTLGIPLSTKGLSRKSKFTLSFQKLFNVSTFGKYTTELGIPTITTESPWNSSDISERKRSHLIVIKSVIENFQLRD